MNGGGEGGGVEEDRREEMVVEVECEEMERKREKTLLMWGYLPGVSPQRSPMLHPVVVRMPESAAGERWKDTSGGGCGFALAISESGKIYTWGSTDDVGQSYVTSGKHEEIPEVFNLPTEVPIIKAAAGWAHCVAVAAQGDVYTWGWKECVPTHKSVSQLDQSSSGGTSEKEEMRGGFLSDQASPRSQSSRASGTVSGLDSTVGDENTKRRRLSSVKVGSESSSSGEEVLSAPPCLVTLGLRVRILSVAAGGRHTLALSAADQVWGWGYGGEGQLGLGTRIRNVSSPHPVPCLESASLSKCGHGSTDDELSPKCVSSLLGIKIHGIAAGLWHTICTSVDGGVYSFGGNQFGQLGTGSDQAELQTLPKLLDHPCLENKNAKLVSCGARHSAMMSEDGQIFCWGWNKYGQLGLGDSIDRNIPALVPIENYQLKNVSCGWWHTLALAESPTKLIQS